MKRCSFLRLSSRACKPVLARNADFFAVGWKLLFSQKEMSRVRAKIIQEICAEARVLVSEEGYSLIVAENSDSDAFPNVILGAKSDDVTEKLLMRLNDRYRAQMRQPKDAE